MCVYLCVYIWMHVIHIYMWLICIYVTYIHVYKCQHMSRPSRPTLCDPVDCSPSGFSVHGILQAKILEWVASWPSDWIHVSCVSWIAGRFFTTEPPGSPIIYGYVEIDRYTEDEVAGWHHRLCGHAFEQALGAGDGQGGLAWCSPRGCKESDTTERLDWTVVYTHTHVLLQIIFPYRVL